MKYTIEIPYGWTPENCDLCGCSGPQDVSCCDCPVALATPAKHTHSVKHIVKWIECEIDCVESGNTITPNEKFIVIRALSDILSRLKKESTK